MNLGWTHTKESREPAGGCSTILGREMASRTAWKRVTRSGSRDNLQDSVIGGGGRRGVQVDLWVYVCTVGCMEGSLSDPGKLETGHWENMS